MLLANEEAFWARGHGGRGVGRGWAGKRHRPQDKIAVFKRIMRAGRTSPGTGSSGPGPVLISQESRPSSLALLGLHQRAREEWPGSQRRLHLS